MGRDVFKGDGPVLVMAILAEAPSHGYAIAREIERRSGGQFRMKEGSLYPALRVLEQSGWIEGAWEVQPSGPARKVYRLTPEGHGEVEHRARQWKAYARAFDGIVKHLGNEAQPGQGGEDAQPA